MAYRKIPDDILDTIRERIAIERVIGDYVPLKRAGRHFKGLCPFHQEKTPSFTVNTDLQIFKCFGCGESGNVFNFLMKYENITFVEAVEKLALSVGIQLPDVTVETDEKRDEKRRILDITKKAWRLFHDTLMHGSDGLKARQYLSERGIAEKHIIQYGLGFAPDRWDFLLSHFKSHQNLLLSSGLLTQNQSNGKLYDRFRNRILFPIREPQQGSIVAFGGRTLGDDPAKYINSPETMVYRKSQILYGLFESKRDIQQSRSVIIVEGYFDRISMDLAGYHYAVAPCGTSLTSDQVKLLKRYADISYILFDSDSAGMKAAQRALELCLIMGFETRAVPLPEGRDPDDIIRDSGRDAMNEYLQNAMPGIDFLIQGAARLFNLEHPRGRRNSVELLLPFLVEVSDSVDRGVYISRMADLIGVPAESILELYRRYQSRKNKSENTLRSSRMESDHTESGEGIDRLTFLEKELFCFFIQNPEYVAWNENPLTADSMISLTGRAIYELLQQEAGETGKLAVDRIVAKLKNKTVQQELIDLFDDPDSRLRLIHEDPPLLFRSLVMQFQEKSLRKELMSLHRQLKKSGKTPDQIDQLLKQKMEILGELDRNSSLDPGSDQ
jgi:DNA primase